MQNINITVSKDGKTATVTIDLTERLGESGSGKSVIVASTGGNQKIEGSDVVIGINAYVPIKKATK